MTEEELNELLEEFKDRMHLGNGEDSNLENILSNSFEDLIEKCGDYSVNHKRFRELIIERSRYVYNDAVEYFDTNFQSQINSLGFAKAVEVKTDESVQIQSSKS